MSQRIFLSTLIWLVLVNLLIKTIFIFGIDLQVQHQVGQSTYGLYFTLLNLCYIFQIINDFGLNLLHGTDTAFHGHIRKAHWRTILQLKIFLSIAYAVIVFGIARGLGLTDAWELLGWMALNNILISWISLLRGGISGMARYKMEALVSVLDKALMILICGGLFLMFATFRIEWFVWAQTISLGITLVTAILVSKRAWYEAPKDASETNVLITFKSTIPFCLTTLLMFLYTRSDAILLKKLIPDGEHEVGVFAAGFRLLDAANMIAFLFTPLLIPMYTRLQDDKKETRELIQLASGLMICMAGCISLAGFWWARPIMMLCYGREDHQWVTTFSWLILAHIPIGLMYIFGSYLTAVRALWKQNILFTGSVIFNIGLNLLLIPTLSTIGAAFTAFLTQSLTTLGLILLAQRHLQLPVNRQWTIRVVIYFIILIVSGWGISSAPLHWMIEAGAFVVVGVGSAFLLKLMDWKKIIFLLKSAEPVVE